MRIVEVSATKLEGRLDVPWKIATATMATLNSVLVRVVADDGTVGYGECCTRKGGGAAKAVIDEVLAPTLLGRDPRNIEALWDEMYATLRTRGHSRGFLIEAISGVDIALWDMAGRKLGKPVHQLMFGHGRTNLPAYASSVLIDSPDVMARAAAELRAKGYSAIKIKIAGHVSDDTARIAAVREAIGTETKLMLDANSGFDAPDAIAFANRAAPYNVYWLEEPLHLDDLPSYRRLRQASGIRIALGEGEFLPAGFREFLHDGLIDVVQPNITRAGGFTGVRRIAALAQAYGIPVAPHTGASGPVCMAATLQLAAGLSGFLIHEHMYLENPFKTFFKEPLPEPVNGIISVPQGPGLGVEPRQAELAIFD